MRHLVLRLNHAPPRHIRLADKKEQLHILAKRRQRANQQKEPDHECYSTAITVDEYITAHPALAEVRRAIRAALPHAAESIAYNMPAYKINDKPVIYFAGWKRHYSIYPASSQIVEACKAELAPYTVEKGTIRFPYTKPVPVELIQRIAKLRAREVNGQ